MSDYEQNMKWGYKKEEECSKLLQDLYPDIIIRRSDIIDKEQSHEDMKKFPSRSNFEITIKEENALIYGWCESMRRTYDEFLAFKDNLFVKYKTWRTMMEAPGEQSHYLIKPLVKKIDDEIDDVVGIGRYEMEKVNVVEQSSIQRRDGRHIGSGKTAVMKVKVHHVLVRGRNRPDGVNTFLDAL